MAGRRWLTKRVEEKIPFSTKYIIKAELELGRGEGRSPESAGVNKGLDFGASFLVTVITVLALRIGFEFWAWILFGNGARKWRESRWFCINREIYFARSSGMEGAADTMGNWRVEMVHRRPSFAPSRSFSFYRIFLRKKRLVRMNFHSVNGFVESLFSSDGYFLKNCGSFEKEKKFEREGNAFIILVQDQTLGTARFTNVPSPHPSPVFRLVCSRFFATSPSCSILIIDSDFNTARLCAFYIMLEQFPF